MSHEPHNLWPAPAEQEPSSGSLWAELARQTPQAGPAPDGAPVNRSCSFCWAELPASAVECPDCGLAVAQMEAARAARAEADRNWVPPGRRATSGATDRPSARRESAAVAGARVGSLVTEPVPAAARVPAWHPPAEREPAEITFPILTVIVLLLLALSALAGSWLANLVFPT